MYNLQIVHMHSTYMRDVGIYRIKRINYFDNHHFFVGFVPVVSDVGN